MCFFCDTTGALIQKSVRAPAGIVTHRLKTAALQRSEFLLFSFSKNKIEASVVRTIIHTGLYSSV